MQSYSKYYLNLQSNGLKSFSFQMEETNGADSPMVSRVIWSYLSFSLFHFVLKK